MPGYTAKEVIERATRAVVQNTARFSPHARDQMNARGVTANDVRVALFSATSASPQPNGSWRVRGKDCDNNDLVVVLDPGDPVRIITVM